MKLSIHQPDFWPWAGLFHKIACSDKFVIFDSVQAPRGKSWLTRNQILLNGSPTWITLPIFRASNQKIFDVKINHQVNFRTKHLGTMRQAYAKSPYFCEVFEFVEEIYAEKHELARDLSLSIIKGVCQKLGIKTEFIEIQTLFALSDLSELRGNDLILEICKLCQASSYLSGTGCLDFIKPEEFSKNGITFAFQDFVQLEYAQIGTQDFHPSMSILDLLFNLGFEQTSTRVKGNSAF